MPLNLAALAHNKPALIGVGVAVAAGLYVLVKRKQTTGSTTSGAGTAAGYAPPTTYPDTTGTDLVQQWGQFSQALQSDLAKDFPTAGNPSAGTGAITPTRPTGAAMVPPWLGRPGGTFTTGPIPRNGRLVRVQPAPGMMYPLAATGPEF